MKKKISLIYIIGSRHCGSTLLDIILDSHSKIFGAGELESFDKEILCTCAKKLDKCSFWGNILKKVDLGNLKVRRKKLDFILGNDKYYIKKAGRQKPLKDLTGWLKNNELIYREILEKSGTEIIVDSSKDPDRAELLAKNNSIELIVIHLVRDGRAVTWSYLKKYSKALPFMLRWFTFNIKVEILRKKNNFKYIFIRYEDLARNPKGVIKEILRQVGLEYEPGMLHFRHFTHHEVGGNRMRLGGSEEIKEDIDWKQKMPKKYKIMFSLLFGWLNLIYKNKESK